MMKRLISLVLIFLMLFSVTAVAQDAPTVVTVNEWLETKGETTGLLFVQVQQLINPMLAVIVDETGSVNLFGITVDGEFTDFFTADIQPGDILVLWAPRYNEFEGSVEMADAVLLRHAHYSALLRVEM